MRHNIEDDGLTVTTTKDGTIRQVHVSTQMARSVAWIIIGCAALAALAVVGLLVVHALLSRGRDSPLMHLERR